MFFEDPGFDGWDITFEPKCNPNHQTHPTKRQKLDGSKLAMWEVN